MEMLLYRELWFLSGTKLSKRGEKMLKMTLFQEDQTRQQMIKCGSGASCDGERPPIEEFVPPGLRVNHAFYEYKDVLERLRKRFQRVRTDIADDWVLHHDNAPANTALSIREFLAKKNIPVLPHPLYSSDLAPCDFYLFAKLKLKLKGHHFGTIETIQKTVTDYLNTLTENDFQCCYDQWKKRWNRYVSSQGSYFEGDNL